jgi:hypothetical protein
MNHAQEGVTPIIYHDQSSHGLDRRQPAWPLDLNPDQASLLRGANQYKQIRQNDVSEPPGGKIGAEKTNRGFDNMSKAAPINTRKEGRNNGRFIRKAQTGKTTEVP